MVNKMIVKLFGTIFIVNALENLLLLIIFGVPITQQTFIIILVFTLTLSLILKQMGLIKE